MTLVECERCGRQQPGRISHGSAEARKDGLHWQVYNTMADFTIGCSRCGHLYGRSVAPKPERPGVRGRRSKRRR